MNATRWGCAMAAHADQRGLGTSGQICVAGLPSVDGLRSQACLRSALEHVAKDSLDSCGCASAFPIRPTVVNALASPPDHCSALRRSGCCWRRRLDALPAAAPAGARSFSGQPVTERPTAGATGRLIGVVYSLDFEFLGGRRRTSMSSRNRKMTPKPLAKEVPPLRSQVNPDDRHFPTR